MGFPVTEPTLDIRNLCISVGTKEIVKDLSLTIYPGEVHVLLGQNGCGKTTLLNCLMGLSGYTVTSGSICFLGKDITYMPVSDRARMGLGLLFQRAPPIFGLSIAKIMKTAKPSYVTAERVAEAAKITNTGQLIHRDVNAGFSGGEMKRGELCQLLLQQPCCMLLDEPESGVDLENMAVLGSAIASCLQSGSFAQEAIPRCALIITHTGHILNYLNANVGHVMIDGRLKCHGNPKKLLGVIASKGFSDCLSSSDLISLDPQSPVKACPLPIDSEPKKPNGFIGNGNGHKMENGWHHEEGKPNGILQEDQPVAPPHSALIAPPVDKVAKPDEKGRVKISLNDLQESAALMVRIPECGGYLQLDEERDMARSPFAGVDVMTLRQALGDQQFRDKYFWKAVDRNKDAYTKSVAEVEDQARGYVIVANENNQNDTPIDAALIMQTAKTQRVHNIIIAKKNSVLSIASTCAFCSSNSKKDSHHHHEGGGEDEAAAHVGVSEFYVEEGARICFVMVHNYCHRYSVFPRSAAIVEKNGTFVSTYICLNPVAKVEMYPTARLVGENATAHFSSVVMAREGTVLDLGSRAILAHPGAKADMVSRVLSTGGTVYARAHMVGLHDETRGHIECQGLVLDKGRIHAIPEIEGHAGAEITHEAAVGKICEEKIEYLMCRGIPREEAIQAIVRGFLDVKINGISPQLKEQVDLVISQASLGL